MCVLSSVQGTASTFLAPLIPVEIYLPPLRTKQSLKFLIVGTNCKLEKHPKLTVSQEDRVQLGAESAKHNTPQYQHL